MQFVIGLFLVFCASSIHGLTKEALADEVFDLPGLETKPNYRMFSGYIPIPSRIPGDETRKIFYWFVTKEDSPNPFNETTMLWTNGGPGCSGLIAMFTEQGPFRPTKGGKSLVTNKHAWNKLVNIFFIEQPVGVGFSQTGHPEIYNDENAAEDNRQVIIGFYKKFPELLSSDFYISSESYGGHYMPTLARNILDHPGTVPNFKGLLVGNPIMWSPIRDLGEFETLAGHQILPGPLVANFMKAGCNRLDVYRTNPLCLLFSEQSKPYLQGLDPYAMDFPICNDRSALMRILNRNRLMSYNQVKIQNDDSDDSSDGYDDDDDSSIKDKIMSIQRRRQLQYIPDDYNECAENYADDYLNRKEVQKAIHALPPIHGRPHATCNDEINIAWSRESQNANMIPIFQSLFGHGLKLTIMSGDDDTVCPTASLQHWIWKHRVVSPWKAWKVDKQINGYHVSFSASKFGSSPDFEVYTVHGAGHMIPSTRPEFAFSLLEKFLNRK